MVVPNGPPFARSVSTWIHWWSPVALANALICSWVTFHQELSPRTVPTWELRSATSIFFGPLMLDKFSRARAYLARDLAVGRWTRGPTQDQPRINPQGR